MTSRITKVGTNVEYAQKASVYVTKVGVNVEYAPKEFVMVTKVGLMVEYYSSPMTYGPRIQSC